MWYSTMLKKKEIITVGICTSTIAIGIFSSLYIYKRNNTVLTIIESPSPKLRQTAAPITAFDSSIKALSNNMLSTLRYHALAGFLLKARVPSGLAAPQIGIAKRVVVCGIGGNTRVMINPEIISRHGTYLSKEGCLSIESGRTRHIERSAFVRIRYRDPDNREKVFEARNRYAALLEHEIEHLDGIINTDH
jgi:peptide deformylase